MCRHIKEVVVFWHKNLTSFFPGQIAPTSTLIILKFHRRFSKCFVLSLEVFSKVKQNSCFYSSTYLKNSVWLRRKSWFAAIFSSFLAKNFTYFTKNDLTSICVRHCYFVVESSDFIENFPRVAKNFFKVIQGYCIRALEYQKIVFGAFGALNRNSWDIFKFLGRFFIHL